MKPERNVYVVEKIARGGRSSFQSNNGLVGSSEISIQPPIVEVTPASVVRLPTTEVVEVVDVVDNIPPSHIGPVNNGGGVMIGGSGHNRLLNQLAYG